MSLKDKALKAKSRSTQKAEQGPREDLEFNREETFRKKGKVSLPELLRGKEPGGLEKSISRFLLPEDFLLSTLPADIEYSLQSRLESLLHLLEVCKDLATIEDEAQLWDSVLVSILGQIGVKEAVIFFKTQRRLMPQASHGFILPEEFNFSTRSGLERLLKKEPSIHYVSALVKELVGEEAAWLASSNAELITPIMHYEELLGFIVIGKPIGAKEFNLDDLFYLKLIGELLGSFRQSIEKVSSFKKQMKKWEMREKLHENYLHFQAQIQAAGGFEESTMLLKEYLDKTFKMHTYLLCLLHHDHYEVRLQKGFSEKTSSDFKIDRKETWLYNFKPGVPFLRIQDLKNNAQLMEKFSREEAATVQSASIIPLLFKEKLYGFFFLFDVKEEYSTEDLFYTSNIVHSYFWYLLSQNHLGYDPEARAITLQEPLAGIKEVIYDLEKELAENETPYSIYVIHMANHHRLKNIFPAEKFSSFKEEFMALLRREIFHPLLLSEIFPGQYLIILTKINKSDLWLLERTIRKRITELFPESDFQPLTRSRLYHRPEDPPKTLEELLFE